MSIWTKGIVVALVTVLPLLEGCTRHSKSERYYLVTVNVDLPYWKTAFEGFQKAAAEYGVTVDLRGPNKFDPQAEVEAFRAAVALKPAGILVSVTNSSLLAPEIDAAIAAGIVVTAFGPSVGLPSSPCLVTARAAMSAGSQASRHFPIAVACRITARPRLES